MSSVNKGINLVHSIKSIESNKLGTKLKMFRILLFLIFGAILGLLAKFADTVGINVDSTALLKIYQYSLSMISDITTNLGIWVFIAAVIAARSRSPKAAAIHVFVFFFGVLLAYYVYSTMLFGFFPTYYFYRWGLICLLSPIGAYVVWYARGKGWIAAICSSPPIALLLTIGFGFFYTHSLLQGINLLLSILLLVALPSNNVQRLRVLPFVAVLFFLIKKLELISLLFGGL
ncbi:hypothetical protein [Paenibacillus fonticola]|uniref:hypothetical protein n=1 Tax=Paenibacillus fonticola TaxID=379896 RepID=UPI000371AC16|nr:hypothetical protein [Paenibacillus fonticola]